MARLLETNPFNATLPMEIGATRIEMADLGPVTAILPYNGREDALSEALARHHGIGWPKPRRSVIKGEARIVWSGMEQAMLIGVAADGRLGEHAALIDQSDAWAAVRISGEASRDVLARLCPLDLNPQVFRRGHAARSLIGHMSSLIHREGDTRYLVMTFRSMADTLAHELQEAMTSVAARARLG